MADLLREDFINSLPQPLYVKLWSSYWPLVEVCVETGLGKIDVCGMYDNIEFGRVTSLRDANWNEVDLEECYVQEGEDV